MIDASIDGTSVECRNVSGNVGHVQKLTTDISSSTYWATHFTE